MKVAFDAESTEAKEQKQELHSKLKEAMANITKLTGELEESQTKVEKAALVESTFTEEVATLKGELECSMFQLREVTGARDASNERIKSLEARLESVTKQNEDFEDQNRMLKGMLKSLSKKVQGMYAEHEASRQTLAARSLDLKSIVASSDVVLERARVQSETMLHTKIDIQNILHFVDDESDDTSDTKSTGSCSSEGSDVTPRV